MFAKRKELKKRLFGAALLLATVFFTFGHTFIAPSSIAFADDRAHRDEIPHAPESEEHSPCQAELHQTIIRTTSDDDSQNTLDKLDHRVSVTLDSNSLNLFEYSTVAQLYSQEDLPPRLPLQQKTHLLL